MATLGQLLILGVLLGGAHAQSNYCDTFPHREVTGAEFVEQDNVEVQYLKPSDVSPLASSDSRHDLVMGNCTQLSPYNITDWLCYDPDPNGGVVLIPPQYHFSPGFVIYCVKVLDRSEDGTGGYPVLVEGGLGTENFYINYYSQMGQGLKFYTEIHAIRVSEWPTMLVANHEQG